MKDGRKRGGLALLALLSGCPAPSHDEVVEPDRDGDGIVDAEDCGPDDPEVGPGQPDPPGDELDANCDGLDGTDADGDGFDPLGSLPDCDDADPEVWPGRPGDEVMDGVDRDCDGWDSARIDGAAHTHFHRVGSLWQWLGRSPQAMSSEVDFDGDGRRDLVIGLEATAGSVLGWSAETLARAGSFSLSGMASFQIDGLGQFGWQLAWTTDEQGEPVLVVTAPAYGSFGGGAGAVFFFSVSELVGDVDIEEFPRIVGDPELCTSFGGGFAVVDGGVLVSGARGGCEIAGTGSSTQLYRAETWQALVDEQTWAIADATSRIRLDYAVATDDWLWVSEHDGNLVYRYPLAAGAEGIELPPDTGFLGLVAAAEVSLGHDIEAIELDGNPGEEILLGGHLGVTTDDLPVALDEQGSVYIVPGEWASTAPPWGQPTPIEEVAWSLTSADRAGWVHGFSAAVLDFDCDGRRDIVTTARSEPAVRVWLADTLDALMATPPPASTSQFDLGYSIEDRGDEQFTVVAHNAHDVNGDGCDDLVILGSNSPEEMWVLRGAPR